MTINITAGECLNAILSARYPDKDFVPFNEAMIEGSYTAPLFSEAFLVERAAVHGVSLSEYRDKLTPFLNVLQNLSQYDTIALWFGDEPFCRANLQTIRQALTERRYCGTVTVHIVDELTGNILKTESRR